MPTITLDELLAAKTEGNEHYKAQAFPEAIAAYGKAVKRLPDPDDDEPIDPELAKTAAVVLCNRAACYIALQKAVPALADAQLASDFDPANWKMHWRQGMSLMMMSTSIQRAEQASAAFKRTLQCEGVPEKDRANATAAIGHAETRLAQLREGLAMPDMDPSNCSQQ